MDIKQALASLDHENDAHWTTDGQPRIDALETVMGTKGLKRQAIVEVAPHFTRESAAEAAGVTPPLVEDDHGDAPDDGALARREVTEADRRKTAFAASLRGALAEWSDREIVSERAEALNERERDLAAAAAEVNGELARIREERDRFVRRLEVLDHMSADQRHHATTGGYLASQQAQLAQRAEYRQALKAAGVDLRGVLSLVAGSRVDQAFARRTGYGGQRPAPIVPQHLGSATG